LIASMAVSAVAPAAVAMSRASVIIME